MKIKSIFAAFVASIALAGVARADVTLVIAGGNASQTLLFDRANSLLSSNGTNAVKKTSSTNSAIVTYSGSIGTNTALGNVVIEFNLNGAVFALDAVANQTPVAVVTPAGVNTTAVPHFAVSSAEPETIGRSSSSFASPLTTLVVIDAFIVNTNLPNSLTGVWNLTQREASLLEATSGLLDTADIGGASTSDALYLVGRNSGSAVRTIVDANIYFSGAPSFYNVITNNGQIIPNPSLGESSGTIVTNVINVLSNAVGTVALSNVGRFTPLAFEGVYPTVQNVELGYYPIWGYERWYELPGTSTSLPTQQSVINSLYSWITDPTYQSTSSLFVGFFAPLNGMQATRAQDGGPITPQY
jgi:hypothetical protein